MEETWTSRPPILPRASGGVDIKRREKQTAAAFDSADIVIPSVFARNLGRKVAHVARSRFLTSFGMTGAQVVTAI
jgi:hypothetical protein